MFDILSTYAIVEMLDSEDKAYRAKKQKISDKGDNHKNSFLSARESNAFELLVAYIEDMDKTRRELDELRNGMEKIDLG